MKTLFRFSILVAILSVVTIIFSSCSKDDDNKTQSLVSGSFNGTVTASVDGGAGLTVNVVMPVNNPRFNSSGLFVSNSFGVGGAFSNGNFSINLPTSGLSPHLTDITEFFDYYMSAGDKGKLKISDPGAQIMDIDFIGFFYDEDEDEVYVSGLFTYTSSDKKTTCQFVYVDSDVTVTGSSNISVSLKKGWNRMYVSDKITTKAPDGLKWYFEYF